MNEVRTSCGLVCAHRCFEIIDSYGDDSNLKVSFLNHWSCCCEGGEGESECDGSGIFHFVVWNGVLVRVESLSYWCCGARKNSEQLLRLLNYFGSADGKNSFWVPNLQVFILELIVRINAKKSTREFSQSVINQSRV